MKLKVKGLFSVLLAFILTFGTVISASVVHVFAAPWENTEQVKFTDENLSQSKWPRKYAGNEKGRAVAFCINQHKSAVPKNYPNRYYLHEDSVDRDGVHYLSTAVTYWNKGNDVIPNNQFDKLKRLLRRVLAYGCIGGDPLGLFEGYSEGQKYEITQAAVYQITHHGNLSIDQLPNRSATIKPSYSSWEDVKALLDVVYDYDNYADPEGELYVFLSLQKSGNGMSYDGGQNLIGGNFTVSSQPVKVRFGKDKVLTDENGNTLEQTEGQFQFTIKGGEYGQPQDYNATVSTVDNGDGTYTAWSDYFTFSREGYWEYEIAEVEGTDTSITYDTTPQKVGINVVKQNGKLVAQIWGKDVATSGTPGEKKVGTVTNKKTGSDQPSTEPKIKNTTARGKQGSGAEVSATTSAPAIVVVPDDEELSLTISDTIELEGLDPAKSYTLKTYLWFNSQRQLEKVTENVTGNSEGKATVDVTFDEAVSTEAPQYNVSNELYDGTTKVAEHNGARRIVSERVVTKKTPTVKTKVNKPTLIPAAGRKFMDTVTLKNLTVGTTYTITGKLMDKESKTEVTATCKPITFTAEKQEEEYQMQFSFDSSNYAEKTLVVFETLSWKEGDETKTVNHHEYDDSDQSITIGKKEEPNTPKISTQVKNQYISPAKDQQIIDTVTIEGLEEGKEYTLKGEIRNKKDGSVVESSNYPCPVTFDVDAADMSFSEIDASGFSDGDQLVVFEYLYEGNEEETKDYSPGDGNEIAKHTDITDVAQTSTVKDGKITLAKTTEVKNATPGDEIPYTITVTNERSVPAVVDVIDTPEKGLIYAESSDGGIYDKEEGTLVWDNLEVPANGKVDLVVIFKIAEDASGKLKNRAKVYEPDNPTNVLGIYEDDADVRVLGDYSDEADSDEADSAKTGDETYLELAIFGLIAAGLALALMYRRRMN